MNFHTKILDYSWILSYTFILAPNIKWILKEIFWHENSKILPSFLWWCWCFGERRTTVILLCFRWPYPGSEGGRTKQHRIRAWGLKVKRIPNLCFWNNIYMVSQQVLFWVWAKKLNFENVSRLKLRWKSRIPLNHRSKNEILLSNLTILMKIKARKSCVI